MAPNIAQTVTEVALACFYSFILFIVLKSKVKLFEKAFFMMFVATGIADVSSLLSNVLLRLNRELGLGEEFQYVVLYLASVSSVSFIAHMLGNMFITINRYTSLCLIHKYNKLWSRRNVWAVIGVQYCVSFASATYTATSKLVYIRKEDGTTILKGYEPHTDVFIRGIYVGACVVYATVSVALNARLFAEWHKILEANAVLRTDKREKRLLWYTLFVFIFTMLMCSQQFTRGIAAFSDDESLYLWASKQFYWINDVMLSIPPFSLCLFSSELRQAIFKFFGKRKTACIAVVASTNHTSTPG